MTGRPNLWRIFRWPAALSFVSLVGLVAALLVEGLVDALWTLGIATPLAVIAVKLALQRER